MTDRVSEILANHIANAERQLAYIQAGASFSGITDPIPDKASELVELIDKWRRDLERHNLRDS